MGSYMNFKNFGDTVQPDGSGETPMDNYPLARQSSVYSLTFDEFQSTLAGPGKDFGSMNMEDLLKSIWTAEETQAMSSCPGSGDGMAPGGNLHRQGSLTLPRTLSQKTVDEVWRDVLKETVGAKDGSTGGGSNLEVRQPTLGEMTLEDFLVRAGVVREDIQPSWTANNNGIYGLAPASGFSIGSTIGFQQPPRNQGVLVEKGRRGKFPGQSCGGIYDREGSAYYSTARLWDDGLIDPADTRKILGLCIAASMNCKPESTKYGVFSVSSVLKRR
ncbi:Hypothetical predicted protein [Olea europaea subsp. europaea]|uniref:Uncharacterized protein n=1 Tax=Olea europaea subsp. europaea TaxID=158383 RepID=A0A8S0TN78_OLEEU|nr:Hypothetical predicted protein [Olea europaea subsp. europaea]